MTSPALPGPAVSPVAAPIVAMPNVAVLGTGAVATALTTLFVGAGAHVQVWGRDASHAEWVVEDAAEAHPNGPGTVSAALTAQEALTDASVVVPAVPWGHPLAQVLALAAQWLPGRTVLDVSNPFEMTALGPKLAMVIRGGSAGAQTAALLPAGTAHVHAFTHTRADFLLDGARLGAALPYVSAQAPDDALLALLRATGWVPVRVGSVSDSAQIEAGGPWEGTRGAARLAGILTPQEAREDGLLPD